MFGWDSWKKQFDKWEDGAARQLEELLKSPLLLDSGGALLSAVMKAKAASDQAAARWWGALGLPTRRDQERMLHLMNQLQSRLLDLEEQLEDAKAAARAAKKE